MSVNINMTGTASRQIVISNEQNATNIIAAVNSALTSLGWSLIDSLTSGVNNAIVTRVYAAPNNDGPNPTTKYMIIRYDTIRGLWFVNACEFWNATTKVSTNETYTAGGAFPLSLQYSNNVIYVFATPRYAAFATAIRSELGPWQGVFEFEREAPEDIAAKDTPCFGWTSALTIGEYYGNDTAAVTTARPHSFWVPRTRNGHTGWGACQQFVINTAFGMYPPNNTQITYGSTINFPGNHNGMLGNFGVGQEYAWDAGKKVVSSLKLAGSTSAYNTGRIYGIHVIPPTGAVLDTTQLPVDGNGFFSAAGTSAVHYIMPVSGGPIVTALVGSSRLQSVSYNSGSPSAPAFIRQIVVIGGRFVYAATHAGVWRLDLDTMAWTQMAVVAITGDVTDVVYDGGANLYFATPTGVTKFDWTENTAVSVLVGGGARTLAIDDDYIYVSARETTTTPRIEIISRSTFTIDRTYVSNASNTTSTPGFTDMCVDYRGFVYASVNSNGGGSAVSTYYVWRIDGHSGTGTFAPLYNMGHAVGGGGIYLWEDRVYTFRGHSSGSFTSVFQVVNANTLTTIGPWAHVGGVLTTSGSSSRLVPFKGYLAAGSANNPGHITFGLFNNAAPGVTTMNNYAAPTMHNALIPTTQPNATLSTDGVALYVGGTTAHFNRIGGQSPITNNSGNITAHILFRA